MRPCFLVVDREFSTGISTRKLVIETAKFNVITAYSGLEAIETLAAFPAIRVAVVDEHIRDISCRELISGLKDLKSDLVVIAIGDQMECGNADYCVGSSRPEELLETLRKLLPGETAAIYKTSQALASSEEHPSRGIASILDVLPSLV